MHPQWFEGSDQAAEALSVLGEAKLPANAPVREQLVFGEQTRSNQRLVEYLGGQHQGSSMPDDLHFHGVEEPRAAVRRDSRLYGP